MKPKLRVHLLYPYAIAPVYAHEDDSGMDVFSTHDVRLHPLFYDRVPVVQKIHTGLSLEIPPYHEIQVRSKSGLASKGIVVTNSPATIDEGYRGELIILLHNIGIEPYDIKTGDKVAQIVLAPVTQAEIVVMDDTQRVTGGFGSTGK